MTKVVKSMPTIIRGTVATILVLVAMTAMTACGDPLEPSGGRPKEAIQPAAAGSGSENAIGESAAPTSGPSSEASSEASSAPASTSASDALMAACHKQGSLLDRIQGECSETFSLTESYACDRDGIRQAFAGTGFQIDQVLDRSLGRQGSADDRGEGFSIDQCGEGDGRRLVYLIKIDGDGRVLVREIVAKIR